jgi:hypothetical protein
MIEMVADRVDLIVEFRPKSRIAGGDARANAHGRTTAKKTILP